MINTNLSLKPISSKKNDIKEALEAAKNALSYGCCGSSDAKEKRQEIDRYIKVLDNKKESELNSFQHEIKDYLDKPRFMSWFFPSLRSTSSGVAYREVMKSKSVEQSAIEVCGTRNHELYSTAQDNYNKCHQILIFPRAAVQRNDIYKNSQLNTEYSVKHDYGDAYQEIIDDHNICNALTTQGFRYLRGEKNRNLGDEILHVEFYKENSKVTTVFGQQVSRQIKINLEDLSCTDSASFASIQNRIKKGITQNIIDIFELIENNQFSAIVVNCEEGQSRSAAFAYALEYVFGKLSLEDIRNIVVDNGNSVTPHPEIMNAIIRIANQRYGLNKAEILPSDYHKFNISRYSDKICAKLPTNYNL